MSTRAAPLPLGVKITAAFLFVVGAISFVAAPTFGEALFIALGVMVGAAAIVAGVGLLRGARWGWITGVAFLAFAVVIDLLMFTNLLDLPALLLHGALLAYLLRVRALFLAPPPPREGVWTDATP